jgi:hypothetical protein
MNSVLYTANLNFQESNGSYIDSSYTYSHGVYDYLAVTNKTANKNTRDGMNYNGELLYRKKLEGSAAHLRLVGEMDTTKARQRTIVLRHISFINQMAAYILLPTRI